VAGPNVYGSGWEFTHRGVGMTSVTKPGGAELPGATLYELEPGARWADLHVHSRAPFTAGQVQTFSRGVVPAGEL
jgi:hypothetical protein